MRGERPAILFLIHIAYTLPPPLTGVTLLQKMGCLHSASTDFGHTRRGTARLAALAAPYLLSVFARKHTVGKVECLAFQRTIPRLLNPKPRDPTSSPRGDTGPRGEGYIHFSAFERLHGSKPREQLNSDQHGAERYVSGWMECTAQWAVCRI